jgi:hypothetical protein
MPLSFCSIQEPLGMSGQGSTPPFVLTYLSCSKQIWRFEDPQVNAT